MRDEQNKQEKVSNTNAIKITVKRGIHVFNFLFALVCGDYAKMPFSQIND